MSTIISIIAAIFAIFIIIVIHEMGHFLVARWSGVKVHRFSIGFGKALWSWKDKKGTEYVIAAIPLGGYIKMLDESEGDLAPEDVPRAFNRQPIWKRLLIALAGPAINFVLAIFAFWVIYLSGVVHVKPVVGKVVAGSIAARSGVHSGDEIMQIDGKQTYSWQRVLLALVSRAGDKGNLVMIVLPRGKTQVKTLKLKLDSWKVDPMRPDYIKELGLIPYQPKLPPVVGRVLSDSPASKAGLLQGDLILSVAGVAVPDWINVIQVVQQHPGKTVPIKLRRQGKVLELPVHLVAQMREGKREGFLGVMVKIPKLPDSLVNRINYSFLGAFVPAVGKTASLVGLNFTVLFKLLLGKMSISTLGGPISIFKTAGEASLFGFKAYLGIIAYLSLTIGFFNLLPVPGLDGGHMLFLAIEGVTRRPVPPRYQMVAVMIGVFLLVWLMLQATINDISRLL